MRSFTLLEHPTPVPTRADNHGDAPQFSALRYGGWLRHFTASATITKRGDLDVTRLGSVYSPSPCSITVTHAPLQSATRQNLLDWHHCDTLMRRRQSPTWTESRLAASRRCLLLSQSLVTTFRRYFPLTRSVLAGNHRVHWSRACEF